VTLSINLATIRAQCGLREAVDVCLAQGIRAIAPWRDQVAAVGLAEAARIVRESGLRVTGLCRGGMFPAADAAGRRAALDDNRRAVEEAAALGADCLVLVVGGLPPGSRDIEGARAMVADGIGALREDAITAGVPLAIEPLHPMYAADRACVNTLGHALDICDRVGPGVGVAIDVYHVWWDPDLAAQIARAGPRILAHHICDWLVPTTDLLLDRGMMGDGVIDLARIRSLIEAAGYSGPQEVEIFSKNDWWTRPAHEVVATCRARYAAHCLLGGPAARTLAPLAPRPVAEPRLASPRPRRLRNEGDDGVDLLLGELACIGRHHADTLRDSGTHLRRVGPQLVEDGADGAGRPRRSERVAHPARRNCLGCEEALSELRIRLGKGRAAGDGGRGENRSAHQVTVSSIACARQPLWP